MRGIALLAVLLAAGLYAGTWSAGFAYDDYPYVVDNADLRGGPERIPALFGKSFPSHAPERGLYRPLTAATYVLDRAGSDAPSPFRYHLTNWGLGILLVLGAHALLSRLLSAPAAAAGTLLFAAHPVHVESVAWVTGRSELLAGIGVLFAVALGLDAARGRGGTGRLAAVAGISAAAVLAKENGAVAGPALALAVFLLPGIHRSRAWRAVAAAGAGIGAALAARAFVLGMFGPAADERVGAGDLAGRGPLILGALGEHLRLLAAPWPLHVKRMTDIPEGLADGRVLAGAVLLLLLAAAAYGSRRDRPRLFLLLWPLVALAPVLHLVPIGETVAERFLLVPSLGVCGGLASWLLREGGGTARRGWIAVAALVALGSVATVRQTRVWHDELSLWTHASRYVDGHAGIWAGLGDAYTRRGEPGAAAARYRRALQIDPGLTVARLALASALDAAGRPDEALAESREAARIDGSNRVAWNNLGARLARAGRLEESLTAFDRALEISPTYPSALRNAIRAALSGRGGAGDPRIDRYLEMAARADPPLEDLAELRRAAAGARSVPAVR